MVTPFFKDFHGSPVPVLFTLTVNFLLVSLSATPKLLGPMTPVVNNDKPNRLADIWCWAICKKIKQIVGRLRYISTFFSYTAGVVDAGIPPTRNSEYLFELLKKFKGTIFILRSPGKLIHKKMKSKSLSPSLSLSSSVLWRLFDLLRFNTTVLCSYQSVNLFPSALLTDLTSEIFFLWGCSFKFCYILFVRMCL